MKVFGFDVDEKNTIIPFKAKAAEKSICRLNRSTCCSEENYLSIQE